MTLPIRTSETNQRQHHVYLDEPQLRSILAKLIADQVGVDLHAKNVALNVSFGTSGIGSLGPTSYHARITITEDFGPAKD